MASLFRGIFNSAKSMVNNITVNSANFAMQSIREMASKKHKKILRLAKGFRGRANSCYSIAYHRVLKAKQYAYRDRKVCFVTLFFYSFITNLINCAVSRLKREKQENFGLCASMLQRVCMDFPITTSSTISFDRTFSSIARCLQISRSMSLSALSLSLKYLNLPRTALRIVASL